MPVLHTSWNCSSMLYMCVRVRKCIPCLAVQQEEIVEERPASSSQSRCAERVLSQARILKHGMTRQDLHQAAAQNGKKLDS